MKYPLISEYIDSILCSDENFDSLNYLRPVLDQSGNPVMSSGNFAVVFKMRSEKDGRYYALKCFLKDQAGRGDAYRMISDELEYVSSPYLAHVAYYDSELFVDANGSDDTEFPVLLMDWVDGMPLDAYVREHRDDKFALHELAYRFSKLSMWLLTQPFAHGDLKPDNILVKPSGSLVLVDYDGMYVPKMQGCLSRELGSPDYRHPNRTSEEFNEHIDDFSLSVLVLSLKAISLDPSLLDRRILGDGLLLSVSDFRNPSESEILKSLSSFFYDSEFERLYSLFLIVHSCGSLSDVSFRLMAIEKPKKPEICEIEENLSTNVTDEDIANGITDEYGVVYSRDGKRLLKGNDKIIEYKVKEGTKVICDCAFRRCQSLSFIVFPNGVTSIGYFAFCGCKSLSSITLPCGITSIGHSAFGWCESLLSITLPSSVTFIGDFAFSWCESLSSITLPNGVTSIGDRAFLLCKSLSLIVLPKFLKYIGGNPFKGCKCHIESISHYFKIKNNVLYNSDMSKLISYLSEKKEFIVPNGVTSIGDSAFGACISLSSITLPNSVTSIGDGAFSGCSSLLSITLPNGVTSIGDGAFMCCSSLASIIFPNGVISIGYNAFLGL